MSHLSRFDQWVTGAWLWRWRRYRAENRMDDAGNDDAAARSVHQREWAPFAFAEKYGRLAPPSVRGVVEHAEATGANPAALAIVVANRDIMERDARVVLRDERMIRAIAIATRTMSSLALVYWILVVLLAPITLGGKALLLAVGVLVIGSCTAIWELYGGKSLRAMRTVRAYLEHSIQELSTDSRARAQVIDITTRRNG